MTEKSDRIRGLDRGLAVIEHLARNGHSSLADLRKSADLPNPTLIRVLNTLVERRWVRRNIVEGRYELSHALGAVLGENARGHVLAELAAPFLLDLKARQAGWPSDLSAVIEPGMIEIVESTRIRGPMAPTRTGLGLRPSMVYSAHGRAILAFSAPEIAAQHIERIKVKGSKEERNWIDSGRLDEVIRQSRAQGFGERKKAYWEPPFDPGPELGAMAVPILSTSGVHGSVSLVWIAEDMSLDEVLSIGSLDDLRRTAARIGVALERYGVKAPIGKVSLTP